MNNVALKAKTVWDNNKGKIAVVGIVTTVLAVALVRRNAVVTNDFLKEKNLFDEFYFAE